MRFPLCRIPQLPQACIVYFISFDEIGNKGEDLDFTVHNRVWCSILVLPTKRKNIQAVTSVIHLYFLPTIPVKAIHLPYLLWIPHLK
jgi:hypothetical protein